MSTKPADTAPDPLKELRDRVAAAKEKSAARQLAAEEAKQKKHLEEELVLAEIEERESYVLDTDIIAVFSPKDGSMIVVKTPKEAAFQSFQKKMQTDKTEASDYWTLVKTALVYPDKTALDAIVQAAPGMLIQAANACIQLAAATKQEAAGK
jgi:hypothetical protein